MNDGSLKPKQTYKTHVPEIQRKRVSLYYSLLFTYITTFLKIFYLKKFPSDESFHYADHIKNEFKTINRTYSYLFILMGDNSF